MSDSENGTTEKKPFLAKDFLASAPFQLAQGTSGSATAAAPSATATPAQDTYIDVATGKAASTADIAMIQTAKGMANDWLDKVITTLKAHKAKPDPAVADLIDAFFKTRAAKDVDTLLSNYQNVAKNLNGGVTYKIDKQGEYWGKTGGYDTAESTLGREFYSATSTDEERAGTLIHEATHRQATPSLWGFRGKLESYCIDVYNHADPTNSVNAWNKLKSSDLMTTTDIYAAFAAALNGKDYLGYWGCMPRPLRNHLKVGPP